jgi:hypothetical protein
MGDAADDAIRREEDEPEVRASAEVEKQGLLEGLAAAEEFLRAQGGDDLYDLADAVAEARLIVEATE